MKNKGTENRMCYFDSLRLIAMTIIYVTHFIAAFGAMLNPFVNSNIMNVVFEGISGKLGVCIFGILLGYFAFLSKDDNSARYAVKRYTYFLFSGFVINALYAIAGHVFSEFTIYDLKKVLVESVTLDAEIYPTYWCIRAFFTASLLSYINGKAKVSGIVILMEMFIFIIRGDVWVAVCLMGNLLAKYKDFDCAVLKHRIVRVLLWVVLLILIRRPESNLTYLIQGGCCMVMIYLIMQGTVIKAILNNRFTGKIGEKGMGVFLLHPLLYTLLGPVFFDLFSSFPAPVTFFISMVLCFVVIVIFSFPVVFIIQWLTNIVVNITLKIQHLIETKLKPHGEV